MKQRRNPRIVQSSRVVVFRPVLRTQGGYDGVMGLRAAIAEGQLNAFLGAYSAAGAACVVSVPAPLLHLFPPGKPSPARQSHARLSHPCWVERNPSLLLSKVIHRCQQAHGTCLGLQQFMFHLKTTVLIITGWRCR